MKICLGGSSFLDENAFLNGTEEGARPLFYLRRFCEQRSDDRYRIRPRSKNFMRVLARDAANGDERQIPN